MFFLCFHFADHSDILFWTINLGCGNSNIFYVLCSPLLPCGNHQIYITHIFFRWVGGSTTTKTGSPFPHLVTAKKNTRAFVGCACWESQLWTAADSWYFSKPMELCVSQNRITNIIKYLSVFIYIIRSNYNYLLSFIFAYVTEYKTK